MNRALLILIAVLLLLLAGTGAYWVDRNFTSVEEAVDKGPSARAKENPLLAAERFLEAHARKVVDLHSLGALPPTSATLIMPGERFEIGQDRATRLLDWVRAGGHLMVTAQWRWSDAAGRERDFLLAPLDVRLDVAKRNVTERQCHPLDIDLADADDFMLASLAPQIVLLAGNRLAPFETIRSEYGSHVLRYRVGEGVLTILSSAFFLDNGRIGKYDNAGLLWHLVRIRPEGEIWMIRSSNMPPLWKWLWQNAWMAVVSAAAMLLAWLLARGRRFGPPLPQPGLRRRSLLDHVRASGAFFWRAGRQEKLLRGARAALLDDLRRRHPGLALGAQPQQASRLASLTGQDEAEVARALFHPCPSDEFEFTRIIQLLALVRKNL